MIKKYVATLGLACLAFASFAAAAVIGNVSISGSPSFVPGATLEISGSCGVQGISPEIMHAPSQISVVQGGSVTVLRSVTLDSNASFQTTVTLPSSFGTGPASLTATCPQGDVLVTNIIGTGVDITPVTASLVVLTPNPTIGGLISFSGTCGGASGSVEMAIAQGSNRIIIGSVPTGSGGAFSGTLTIPNTFVSGGASLLASCPSGVVVAASINLNAASPGTVPTGGTAAGGGATPTSGVSTTPRGGVAAGLGEQGNTGWILTLLAVATAIMAYVYSPNKQSQLQ